MPPEHDLDPGVRTEKERLAHRQEQASMAFEMDHPPVPRSRVARFHYGTIEHDIPTPTTAFSGGGAYIPDVGPNTPVPEDPALTEYYKNRKRGQTPELERKRRAAQEGS